ncbi:MAG TPA: protein kinase [Thermoanaerobaculia bacterium]|nr:protein kinase [Thermoanaerobaculia bacterium]
MPLAPGARLGTYEILAPLGAGGMGTVYRARDPKLRREVAIKVLPDETADDPGALVRFQREARAVAALSHPNILAIHDFGISEGVTYAVAELLHGETLRQRLGHGPIPVRRAIEIAREIALGLSAAHEKGIVHRDLKPDNVFLARDGRVKILDFGLARKLRPVAVSLRDDTLSDRTEPGKIVGTTGYMSPEQIRGDPVDARSDIFAFGAMLYEMLSGKRAFRGDTSVETLNAILREEPPPLAETGRAIPPVLERIAAHCLEKQADARFQSARDLAFDLASLSISTASDTGTRFVPVKNPWRRHAALAGAAAAALALAFWAGDLFGHSRRHGVPPTFRRLTFRRGTIDSARFAPDGKTVVYGAAWDGQQPELYSVRTDAIESRPLGLERADVLSISSRGDLAVLLRRQGPSAQGMLARVPLGGGAARELMESVSSASWSPGGDELAILRSLDDGKHRLEFPLGRPLYDAFALRPPIAVSPDGRLVAVTEIQSDRSRARLLAIDRGGHRRVLTAGLEGRPEGLAWSADSSEVFYVGGMTSESQALRAVDLEGRERIVMPAVGAGLRLHDLAPDGRMLLERSSRRMGLICRQAAETRDREISWLDGSDIRGVSSDGLSVVFREAGDGGRSDGGVFLRRCDGSPALRLGNGEPFGLSRDGLWALTLGPEPDREIVLLPTGAGSPRRIAAPGIRPQWAAFLPDGGRIAVGYESDNGEALVSLVPLDGGAPRRLTVPRMAPNGLAFSPDGASLAYVAVDGKPMTLSLQSGRVDALPGPVVGTNELLRAWSEDGKSLIFAWTMGVPAKVSRRDVATGKTSPWLELAPSDAAGVTAVSSVAFAPDGNTWAYSYNRTEASDLFVVEGLK